MMAGLLIVDDLLAGRMDFDSGRELIKADMLGDWLDRAIEMANRELKTYPPKFQKEWPYEV